MNPMQRMEMDRLIARGWDFGDALDFVMLVQRQVEDTEKQTVMGYQRGEVSRHRSAQS